LSPIVNSHHGIVNKICWPISRKNRTCSVLDEKSGEFLGRQNQ